MQAWVRLRTCRKRLRERGAYAQFVHYPGKGRPREPPAARALARRACPAAASALLSTRTHSTTWMRHAPQLQLCCAAHCAQRLALLGNAPSRPSDAAKCWPVGGQNSDLFRYKAGSLPYCTSATSFDPQNPLYPSGEWGLRLAAAAALSARGAAACSMLTQAPSRSPAAEIIAPPPPPRFLSWTSVASVRQLRRDAANCEVMQAPAPKEVRRAQQPGAPAAASNPGWGALLRNAR